MRNDFELLLFTTDVDWIAGATAGGVGGIVVDWERHGKFERQLGYDTQISNDNVDDLRRVRAATTGPVICRINKGASFRREIDVAAGLGCDEILLPMVTSVAEVATVLDYVVGRYPLKVGILVETERAVSIAAQLARLPLSRVYIGLNDLSIDRGRCNIFEPLIDGTLESLRMQFTVPVGFAGLTLPGAGFPIPCRLLMAEMARLGCHFTFLRRSFLADVPRDKAEHAARLIGEALKGQFGRPHSELVKDRELLEVAVRSATAFFEEKNGRQSAGRSLDMRD